MRVRRIAIVWGAWTAIGLFALASTYVRTLTGEIDAPPGWAVMPLATIPFWGLLTPPILWIAARVRSLPAAITAHALAFAAVIALDGLLGWLLFHGYWGLPHSRQTYWQLVWKWAFPDLFFYGGIVAVERAARYQRLYVERRVQAAQLEAQLSRAQLQALQMQIRPHFLFNTLNAIAGLVRTGEQSAATEMLAGLGDLLRALLRSDGAQVVTLERELDFATQYLRIEQVRFGDRLRVDIAMEEGLEEMLVPNLILQPLVENAIRHGIGAHTCAGRLAIRCERSEGALRIAVSNSGDPGRKAAPGNGIGLANTRARLEQLYGDAHRFELLHTAVGTSAVLEIPLRSAP